MDSVQEQELKRVPQQYSKLIERAYSGKASASVAIRAKCLECSAYQRDEYANCTVVTCPLHAFRFVRARRRVAKTEKTGRTKGLVAWRESQRQKRTDSVGE